MKVLGCRVSFPFPWDQNGSLRFYSVFIAFCELFQYAHWIELIVFMDFNGFLPCFTKSYRVVPGFTLIKWRGSLWQNLIELKYVVSFDADGETSTEMGSVAHLPLSSSSPTSSTSTSFSWGGRGSLLAAFVCFYVFFSSSQFYGGASIVVDQDVRHERDDRVSGNNEDGVRYCQLYFIRGSFSFSSSFFFLLLFPIRPRLVIRPSPIRFAPVFRKCFPFSSFLCPQLNKKRAAPPVEKKMWKKKWIKTNRTTKTAPETKKNHSLESVPVIGYLLNQGPHFINISARNHPSLVNRRLVTNQGLSVFQYAPDCPWSFLTNSRIKGFTLLGERKMWTRRYISYLP